MLYGISERLSDRILNSLNPYFFGKCSTAPKLVTLIGSVELSLNPYFFGKCSTAVFITVAQWKEYGCVLILIFLENALRR